MVPCVSLTLIFIRCKDALEWFSLQLPKHVSELVFIFFTTERLGWSPGTDAQLSCWLVQVLLLRNERAKCVRFSARLELVLNKAGFTCAVLVKL